MDDVDADDSDDDVDKPSRVDVYRNQWMVHMMSMMLVLLFYLLVRMLRFMMMSLEFERIVRLCLNTYQPS